jgi:ABC-type dipeptide/oligopeptide/nickel transport system permease component
MGRYIVRRLIYLFVVLFVISGITFVLEHSVPGGPFDREKPLPPVQKANIERFYRLNDPLGIQYMNYLSDVAIPSLTTKLPIPTVFNDYLIQFKMGNVWVRWMNFGPTYSSKNRSVNDIFRQQLPVSFQLGMIALFIAVIIGIPLGILSGLKPNTVYDYIGMSVAIFGVSVPAIVLGPILVWIFGVSLKWLPPTGWGSQSPFILGFIPKDLSWNFFRYAILPAVVLGLGGSAILARLTRASLLQVLQEDFIRTARAKGLQEPMVIFHHALKNSLIPVVTILGPMFAALVTGTFVVETIFGIPGMGRYFVTSITNRDYPVIMGTILLYAVFLVVANLVVDIVYAYLDPRIRYD